MDIPVNGTGPVAFLGVRYLRVVYVYKDLGIIQSPRRIFRLITINNGNKNPVALDEYICYRPIREPGMISVD